MSVSQQRLKWSDTRIKKFNRMVFAAVVIVAIVIGIVFRISTYQKKKIIAEGLHRKVVVINKYKTGTRKNFTYHMELAWFTEGEKVAVYERKINTEMSPDEKFSDEVLSNVFGEMHRTKLGEYETFNLKYVDGHSYNNLDIGDVATLVYLEGQPKEGIILKEKINN